MTEERRYGHPRTDEERKARHKLKYGTDELPPRGTGRHKGPGTLSYYKKETKK